MIKENVHFGLVLTDRTSLKGVYRRSYQMATNQVSEGDFLK